MTDEPAVITSDIDDIFTEATAEKAKQQTISYLAQLGGRKFMLAFLIYVGVFALAWFKLVDEGIYSVLTLAILTSYVVGNVSQDAILADSGVEQALTYLAKLGGRKFILSLLIYAGTIILCWYAKIGGNVFSVVTATLIAGYIAGNVIQKKL